MKRSVSAFFAIIILIISNNLFGQNKAETKIKQLLQRQEACWNRGDLNCFMEGYWNSDSLMFMGKSGITYGWKNTLEKYIKGYPDTASMGKLQFDVIKIKKLSPQYYFIVGKWNLKRTIGDVGGYFSLLFKYIDRKWLIVSDHTS